MCRTTTRFGRYTCIADLANALINDRLLSTFRRSQEDLSEVEIRSWTLGRQCDRRRGRHRRKPRNAADNQHRYGAELPAEDRYQSVACMLPEIMCMKRSAWSGFDDPRSVHTDPPRSTTIFTRQVADSKSSTTRRSSSALATLVNPSGRHAIACAKWVRALPGAFTKKFRSFGNLSLHSVAKKVRSGLTGLDCFLKRIGLFLSRVPPLFGGPRPTRAKANEATWPRREGVLSTRV